MSQDNLKTFIASGLPALKAGGDIAAAATDEINNAATDPDLKAALEQGNATSKEWRARVERAIQETGAEGEGENPILEAHYEVSKQIMDAAPDAQVKDLGIIAAGQLALHYWIAAFGTMAAYAKHAGLEQTEQGMTQSVEEAKEADEAHTQLAAKILAS